MARLVTKFKYLKPSDRRKVGGYVKYIATREGVEKLDDSQKFLPATAAQKKAIEKICKDSPELQSLQEHKKFLQDSTVGTASAFLSRAAEHSRKTYADYIALRPRAERIGTHGLFTDDGVPVRLSKVSAELNAYPGNVYTAIISLRREDAVRLGFDHGARWRDLLRSQRQVLAESLKIPPPHLRWYAAFHDEGHHPHVHLIAYSAEPREGHLSKQGVHTLRSSLARDIFAQDLLCIYEEQTQRRDDLTQTGREILTEFITHDTENLTVETLLLRLSEQLSQIGGKKQYAYLPPELKNLVDEILNELSKDERIAALYDRWCESREQILDIYDEATHERIPLAQNREFRSMKNAIIQAAMQISQETTPEMRSAPKEERKDDSGESNKETASAEVAEEPKPTEASAQTAQIPAKSKSHAATVQLFRILAQLLQGSTPQREQDDSRTDRKLRRRTQEKEQAHGLKHS